MAPWPPAPRSHCTKGAPPRCRCSAHLRRACSAAPPTDRASTSRNASTRKACRSGGTFADAGSPTPGAGPVSRNRAAPRKKRNECDKCGCEALCRLATRHALRRSAYAFLPECRPTRGACVCHAAPWNIPCQTCRSLGNRCETPADLRATICSGHPVSAAPGTWWQNADGSLRGYDPSEWGIPP